MKHKIVTTMAAALLVFTSVGGLSACTAAGSHAVNPNTCGSARVAVAAEEIAAAATRRAFAALEKSYHSRLGVMAVDLTNNRMVAYRSNERFAFASTNQAFIAAAVLHSLTLKDLDNVVHFTPADLLHHSPMTTMSVGNGMTIRQLIDAMLQFNDKTAANLLVAQLGIPDDDNQYDRAQSVQNYLRGIGDKTTYVNRLEPNLNTAILGDAHDTTTPAQFAKDLRAVFLGSALDTDKRALLRSEMFSNATGRVDIKAGVNGAWSVADTPGTGEHGVQNDIAVIYPPQADPIVLIVMTAPENPNAPARDTFVAAATKLAISGLTQ